MTSEQWQRVKAIVYDAGAIDPVERARFVADACRGDEALRLEVASLLASADRVGDRFERPVFTMPGGDALRAMIGVDPADDEPGDAMIGRRIGPYEIRREIGRGGMGAVYLASRIDAEFTQEVALKITKRGADTDAIVRRFRAERQILAGLNHPHIARLLDGGTTSDGLPYIVMEYVDGQPITTYCDSHSLGIVERIQLFCEVVGAVADAHQHLIVHRDIKPSNVLVSADGRPKLLDFGLATILSPDPADGSETESVKGWMTPDFASPEQIRGGRVTTASDIYSLGVLLYELLCGRRPFRRRSRGAALIRDVDGQQASKPSAAVVRMDAPADAAGDSGEAIADAIGLARGTTVVRLQRALRGDLDHIVLKALHEDPGKRYRAAQELSEDLHRHLEGLPISARRDSFTSVATRFVRRHTAAAAALALLAITLVAATVITTAQARAAERARAQAERRFTEVRQLATSFLFEFHDSIDTLPGATRAREMVVKTAQQYLDSLAQDAGADRALTLELSTAYLRLADVQGRPSASRTGDTDEALRNYERALALRRSLVALEPSNVEYMHSLGIVLVRMGPIFQVRGDPQSAVTRTREGMRIMDRLVEQAPGPDIRRDAFRAPLYLGDALADLGEYAGALAMYRRALAIADMAKQDPPKADYDHRMAVINERLGTMFMVNGDPPRALESYKAALEDEQAMRAAEPDNAGYVRLLANGFYHVSDALRGAQKYSDSLAAGERALAMYEELARADPSNVGARKDVGGCLHKLAETLLAKGDSRGAAALLQRAVAIQRTLAAQDAGSVEYRDDLADSLMLSGESLLKDGDASAAIDRLDEARRVLEPIVTERPQQVVYTRGLAQLYADLGDAYALAAHASGQRQDHLGRAQQSYARSLTLWTDLGRRHALWASESGKPSDVSRRLDNVRALSGRVTASPLAAPQTPA